MHSSPSLFLDRRKTREVGIGKLAVGGHNPIWVQSMTTLSPEKVEESLDQINRLVQAGCEIVRVAVPDRKAALSLGALKQKMAVPLIADIHFSYQLALIALDQGVDKIRLNPGNITDRDKIKEVVLKAKDKGIPIRVGVNSGSVNKRLLEKYGYPSVEAMVESALESIEFYESLGFHQIILSIKSSDVKTAIGAYLKLSQETDYPLHVGVTEAGKAPYGIAKSAIGLGYILLQGVGDTIRVSLVGDPVQEVHAAFDILKATGRRILEPEIVACPTCGRIAVDLEKVVKEVEIKLKEHNIKTPKRISILGCAVNGPGEAAESDIGVAAGNGEGLIFKRGKIIKKVKESEIAQEVLNQLLLDEKEQKGEFTS